MSECPNCGFQLTPSNMSKAKRLPVDWMPNSELAQWTQAQGYSDHDILLEVNQFRDYWCAKAGKDAAKLDWSATWRNWIRRNPKAVRPQARQPSTTSGPKLSAAQREANRKRLAEMVSGLVGSAEASATSTGGQADTTPAHDATGSP